MTADEINGVEPEDAFDDHDTRLAVQDRLMSYAPPSQAVVDEAHARMALYGDRTRSGLVSGATPRHLRHSVQPCTTDPFNNDGPGAEDARAV